MRSSKSFILATVIAISFCVTGLYSQTTTIIHDFTGGVTDSTIPGYGVVTDSDNNLYGVAPYDNNWGFGMVYELSYPNWQETSIWAFTGGIDGSTPASDLVWDSSGNLYGTTIYGGANNCGVVFELSPSINGWTETTLVSFPCGVGSASGQAGNIVIDTIHSTIYGTVYVGGAYGGGWVYQLVNSNGVWNYSVLTSFNNHSYSKAYAHGCTPWAIVLVGGVIYGSATGCANGSGLIYKLAPPSKGGTPWIESIVYAFSATAPNRTNLDGAYPYALTSNQHGFLYGTVTAGGQYGDGLVFSLNKVNGVWKESLLHTFGLPGDGIGPLELILRSANVMYGTTPAGGLGTDTCGGYSGCGTLFQMIKQVGGQWDETILYDFSATSATPSNPNQGHLLLNSGTIYGTTYYGGSGNCQDVGVVIGCGTVYSYTP